MSWHAPIAAAPTPSLSTAPPARPGLPPAMLPCPPSTATPALHPRPPRADLARAALEGLAWPITAKRYHLRYRLTVPAAPRARITLPAALG